MDRNKTEYVDKTVLNTPKPKACSTIDRKSFQKGTRPILDSSSVGLENSLGVLSLNEFELSNSLLDKNDYGNLAEMSSQLQQQRLLANNSLRRAGKVAGIPSKYLRPSINNSSSISNINLSNESTVSESDLLQTPKNTSTPRNSVASNSSDENIPLQPRARSSLGHSIAQLSYQIGNTDISMDKFVKEFQKTMKKGASQIDSNIFTPADEAASLLMADELSWRRQNGMPVLNNFSQLDGEEATPGKVSAFFQQRSDTLSDFQSAVSPTKLKEPVALIDSSVSFSEDQISNKDVEKNQKSLSISAIQKFLAETEDTPRKVTDYLFSQGKKSPYKKYNQESLPVSKNSSYTSSYSDNEIMNAIVNDKENTDTNNIEYKDKKSHFDQKLSLPEINGRYSPSSSTGSSRTSSALSSLPNGKLPIESTRSELIWGCVKIDKCISQDFLLRNKTSKQLRLQMSLSSHEFKIRKDSRQESDSLSAAKILLHPHESRAIIISFIPTKIGAAVDDLMFTSLDPNLVQTKKQCIRLFGYGGYGKIEFYNLTKDTSGKFWLSLGKLDNRNILKKTFIVKNTGTLPSFAYISFNAKEFFSFANVNVSPNLIILIPNEQKEVVITYTPTLEDHKALQQLVFNTLVTDIGNLHVISGSEVNRGRLRRQCRKYIEQGLEIDPVSNVLKEKVKGEVMPTDLVKFKESPGSLKDIFKLFSRNEVILTLEHDPEQTIIPQYPDESGMFKSLCQDSTTMCLDDTIVHASCKLEPANIILAPPTKQKDCLFLISQTNKVLHFEVTSNPEGLEIFPKDGVLCPGQETILNLSYHNLTSNDKRLFKVSVYVENEVFEANVKINFIHSQSRKSINLKKN